MQHLLGRAMTLPVSQQSEFQLRRSKVNPEDAKDQMHGGKGLDFVVQNPFEREF